MTVTSVAVAPEIKTPIRLAEITLPGPITVPGAVSATPAWSLPSTAVPAAVRPMMLFATVLPSGIGAGDVHAVARIRRDHVAVARCRAADLVIGGVVDPHAVGEVAGLAVAEDITAAGCRADIVGLDQVPRRPHAFDVDAVAQVVRDEIARARDGSADDVARRIDDARRIGGRSRRLDQHPFRAVAGREVEAAGRRSDHADLVAQDLVARCPGLDQHALRSVAGDDVVVLGIGAAQGRVRRAQDHPLLRVALPDQLDRVRATAGRCPCCGSTG